MLEVVNLKKQYKPKKGEPVNALAGVNVKVQEKGLVFILGKSGSGKSTLLNLLGGLDKYDSGDIVIKGKSTKDFKQGDFDSYRNTLVGFIFQEYNLLDDMSVGANIALAIELQGRKATNEEINSILKEVDLDGYGNRKTNELSGGQKQRVAIARALVKNPEIILADEPTGALDSNTGIQIFNILKRLSKDKLVLVVSHDREFAESFGDRVIELADGLVISDIIKIKNDASNYRNQLNYHAGEGFVVNEEYELTTHDLKIINDYLKKNKTLQIKTLDSENSVQTKFVETDESKFKKMDSSDLDMVKSKFPVPMAFKMGSSGLNHKKVRLLITILLSMISFTLFGITDTFASYNKHTAYTQSIIDNEISDLILVKKEHILRDYGNYSHIEINNRTYSKEDIAALEKLTNTKLTGVYADNYSSNYYYRDLLNSNIHSHSYFYDMSFTGLTELNRETIDNLGYTLHGELPDEDDEIVITSYIYEHFSEYGYKNQFLDVAIESSQINSYNDIIGLDFYYTENYEKIHNFEIVGILDTNLDFSKYEALKNSNSNVSWTLMNEFQTKREYGLHNVVIVNDGLIEKQLSNADQGVRISNNGYMQINYGDNINGEVRRFSLFEDYKKDVIFFDSNKKTLNDNEVIVGYDFFSQTFDYEDEIIIKGVPDYKEPYYDLLNELIDTKTREYVIDNYLVAVEKSFATYYDKDNYEEEYLYYDQIEMLYNEFRWGQFYKNSTVFSTTGFEIENNIAKSIKIEDLTPVLTDVTTTFSRLYVDLKSYFAPKYALTNFDQALENGFLKFFGEEIEEVPYMESLHRYIDWLQFGNSTFTDDSIEEVFKEINPYIIEQLNSLESKVFKYNTHSYDNYNNGDLSGEITVVGVYLDNTNNYYEIQNLLVEENIYNKLLTQFQKTNPYKFVVGLMPKDREGISKIVNVNYTEHDGYYHTLETEVTSFMDMANDLIESTASIFLYIGIGFSVFAALMLSNFIGTSVARKKRDIGILRALGARSNDVYRIFLIESLIIGLINFVISIAATITAIYYINTSLREGVGLKLTIFNFGIRQIALILLISVFVSVVASFLPVHRIAKKKPVDAISNK